MALTQLKTSGIADDAITTDKLANAINTERTANTAKSTNATHTGDVTGSGALTIAADAVTGAKIADDAVGAEHIETLDGNVQFADSAELRLGTGSDLQLYHDGSNSHIKSDTNALIIRSDALRCNNNGNTETMIKADADGGVELYHNNSVRAETIADGFKVSHSDDSGATTLKLENNSTHNSQNPKVKIAVDLANGKDGGSIEFIRGNNYQSSAAADSEIVISPTKNDTNTEIVRITQDWFRLHSNCSGIQFNGDTASANALNDYEEGSWTVSLIAGGSSINNDSNNNRYVKIGSMVFITFEISGLTSPDSNILEIGGLPYGICQSREGTGSCMTHHVAYGTNRTMMSIYAYANQSKFRFYSSGNATSWLALTGSNFTTSGDIIGSFMYHTV